MKPRMTMTLVAIVLTALFLPSDTWNFWFAEGEDSSYAEIRIAGEGEVAILAKNLLETPVECSRIEPTLHLSIGVHSPSGAGSSDKTQVPPRSYSFIAGIETDPTSRLSAIRNSPAELLTLTPSERDRGLVLLLVLMALFCYASLVAGEYLAVSRDWKRSKEERG